MGYEMMSKIVIASVVWIMTIACGVQIQERGENEIFIFRIVIQLIISFLLLVLLISWDSIRQLK